VEQIFNRPQQAYTRDLLAAGLEADPDVQSARRAERAAHAALSAV